MKKSRKAAHSSLSSSKSLTSSTKTECKEKTPTLYKENENAAPEDNYNSGFGDYLRSAEGIGMMKLFVLANSIVIIMTMAWPRFLLVGVIYWYSKGMLTMINDYYRDEFKNYLDKEPKKGLLLKQEQQTEHQQQGNIKPSASVQGLTDILDEEGNLGNKDGIKSRGDENRDARRGIIQNSKNGFVGNSKEKDDQVENDSNEKLLLYSEGNKLEGKEEILQLTKPPRTDHLFSRRVKEESSNSITTDCHLPLTKGEAKSILSSSTKSKLNQEPIGNQQVPNISVDDKSTEPEVMKVPCLIEPESAKTGNCFDVDGCIEKHSSHAGDGGEILPNCKLEPLSTALTTASRRFPTCRRKSVNEMIRFWSNYDQTE